MNKHHRILRLNFTADIQRNHEEVKQLLIDNFHDIIDVAIDHDPKESKVRRFLITSDSCNSDQVLEFLRKIDKMSITQKSQDNQDASQTSKKANVKDSLLTVANFMQELEDKLSNSEGGLASILGDIKKLKLAVFGAQKDSEKTEQENKELKEKNMGLQSQVKSLETRIKNIENYLSGFKTVHNQESK